MHEVVYATHPFDVIGWDGYNFPYGFSIHFRTYNRSRTSAATSSSNIRDSYFVVCSFVPRLYDYHPKSVPAPYNHSNIDSDEVLYYVDGDFMSRNNIEQGHITLHPKVFRTDQLQEQWSAVLVTRYRGIGQWSIPSDR
jgi:homogentisate 1,2-dioxygenase